MDDGRKSKSSLITELKLVRRRLSELKKNEARHVLVDKALQESKDKLNEAQQIAKSGYYVFDIKTGYWTNSAELDNIFGIDESHKRDLKGWLEIVHPDFVETMLHYFEDNVLRQHEKFDKEYKIINLETGHEKWVHGLGNLKFDDSKNPVELFGTIQDITERKRTEEALRESERRYATLVRNLPGMAYRCKNDLDWTMEFISDGCRSLTGYKAEELLNNAGTSYADIIHPEDREMTWNLVQSALEDKRPFQMSYRITTKSGEQKWVWEQGQGIFEGRSDLIALEGFITDITGRKQTEEELKTLSTAVRQSPASVMITDPSGNIVYVNPKFCQLTGYSLEEVKGENPRILKSGEVTQEVYERLWQTILSGKEWRGELHNKKKNGDLYWEDVVISAILNELGDITHFLAVKEDITERKQAEVERVRLEEQLHRSQKLETIGTLAGGIAHDFNNILTPIMGYADMAKSSLPSSDPLYDDLEHILNGANRAKQLVEQILLFSRQTERSRHPLKLQSIVKEALKLLRPSIPTTIEIRQTIDTCCDNVLADEVQMHQVILNLCTNAWQAMEEKGGVLTIEVQQVEIDEVTAKSYPNLKDEEYVLLTVSDTGVGIDEATLDRIFEPFFTTKAVDRGTGMGLAVVHGIVRSHEGEIVVRSEEKKGSTFYVYLPVAKARDEMVIEDLEAIQGGRESILVVDDEEAVAKVIEMMLEQFGYRVEVFNASTDALRAFHQQASNYDLVISDLTMPNMTGLLLSEKLHEIRPEFPTIIMTGYGENLSEELLEYYGIHKVIGKPITIRELAGGIRQVLDK